MVVVGVVAVRAVVVVGVWSIFCGLGCGIGIGYYDSYPQNRSLYLSQRCVKPQVLARADESRGSIRKYIYLIENKGTASKKMLNGGMARKLKLPNIYNYS